MKRTRKTKPGTESNKRAKTAAAASSRLYPRELKRPGLIYGLAAKELLEHLKVKCVAFRNFTHRDCGEWMGKEEGAPEDVQKRALDKALETNAFARGMFDACENIWFDEVKPAAARCSPPRRMECDTQLPLQNILPALYVDPHLSPRHYRHTGLDQLLQEFVNTIQTWIEDIGVPLKTYDREMNARLGSKDSGLPLRRLRKLGETVCGSMARLKAELDPDQNLARLYRCRESCLACDIWDLYVEPDSGRFYVV